MYFVLHARFMRTTLSGWQYVSMGGCFALILVIMIAALWVPMRRGLVALEQWEG